VYKEQDLLKSAVSGGDEDGVATVPHISAMTTDA